MTKGVNLSTTRNKSKYQPGSVIYLDEVKDTPDRITLGKVKTIAVEQDGGEQVIVQISKGMISRQPRATDEKKAYAREMRRFETTIYPNKPGFKYCSACGEWVKNNGFREDKRNRDRLQSHCLECQAARARFIYWQKKYTAIPMAA